MIQEANLVRLIRHLYTEMHKLDYPRLNSAIPLAARAGKPAI